VTVDYLRAVAVRWKSDDFPGWVELAITDAAGRKWLLVEKEPVIGAEGVLTAEVAYPIELELECDVVSHESDTAGQPTLTVTLRHGLEHEECGGTFRVKPDQVVSHP
jgi:hypothetical protein